MDAHVTVGPEMFRGIVQADIFDRFRAGKEEVLDEGGPELEQQFHPVAYVGWLFW